jgi:uncharacterized delta-60 repeat protein
VGDGGPSAVDGATDGALPPPTLDDGGTVTVSWLRGNEWGLHVFRQADGKYVVISRNDYQSALIVARFTTAGVLDTTFGSEGSGFASPFLDRIMNAGYQSTAATLLPDGKILLAVNVKQAPPDTNTMALVRLTKDGLIDPTFGNNGVTYPMQGEPFAVGTQSDGKIVVAGWIFKGMGGSGVARFTSAGVLDTTFGNNGVVNGTIAIARAMAIDSADNIVIAGSNLNKTWKVARLLPGGTLDTGGFGTQGIASTDVPSPGTANGVAFGPGGTIIAAGWSANSGVIARYTSAGQPDTSFDSDGVAGPFAGYSFMDLAVQPDGKILTARRGMFPTKSSLHRYNVDGTLDPTFGTGGIAADGLEASFGVLVDPSGDVLVSGVYQKEPLNVQGAGLALTRFSSAGVPVASFGLTGNGMAKSDGAMSADEDGRAVLVQPDGKILAGGVGAQGAVVRFASNGIVETIMTPASLGIPVEAIALDSAGRIYTAGGQRVARLLPAGTLDNSFANINSFKLGSAHGIVLHPSGKVVVARETTSNNTMTALTSDANGGKVVEASYSPSTIDAGVNTEVAGAYAIAVQPDGHMILGGWGTSTANKRDAAFVRIDENLAVDATWRSSGASVIDLTPADFENVRAMAMLPDGSVIAAGVAGDAVVDLARKGAARPTSSVAFVIHLLADGTLDPNFGTANGVWSSGLGTSVARANGVAVRPDGRILVAATRWNGTRDEGVLVGLTSTGAEDTSFAPNGMRVFTFGSSSRLRALTLDPSGGILATGSAYTGPGAYDLALTRF